MRDMVLETDVQKLDRLEPGYRRKIFGECPGEIFLNKTTMSMVDWGKEWETCVYRSNYLNNCKSSAGVILSWILYLSLLPHLSQTTNISLL